MTSFSCISGSGGEFVWTWTLSVTCMVKYGSYDLIQRLLQCVHFMLSLHLSVHTAVDITSPVFTPVVTVTWRVWWNMVAMIWYSGCYCVYISCCHYICQYMYTAVDIPSPVFTPVVDTVTRHVCRKYRVIRGLTLQESKRQTIHLRTFSDHA